MPKRTMIKKIGKRTKEWIRERAKLRVIYRRKGINFCEVGLPGCMPFFGLSFHHRKKRVEYYKCPEKLGEFSETLLACANCHTEMERDKSLSQKMFLKLR